jgi:GNAT superfamily N-acetyltransferase
MNIRLASTPDDIATAFPVMRQLRPGITEETFGPRVERQRQTGYELALLEDEGEVIAVSGFRILDNLAWGRHLYVDDLVTRADKRSRGYGRALFQWLLGYASEHECGELHLDSRVTRLAAHRFYWSQGMEMNSHHFRLRIG